MISVGRVDALVGRDLRDRSKSPVNRGELNTLERSVDRVGQGAGQHGLAEPGGILDEHVPAGEERRDRQAHHVVLAEDHAGDIVDERVEALQHAAPLSAESEG